MSYRNGSSYRGPADRSRSPPRFNDRRASTVNTFDTRHPGPHPARNTAADAPRGPRSQFDGPPQRGPPPSTTGSGSGPPRPSLRDAPPLGSGPRPSFRERDYPDRRERSPPPRERSPPRKFNEPRDFPPRDIDVRSARRASRDGPPSAGSTFSDSSTFAGSSYRGGFASRGRGRGDFEFRGSSRGGRRTLDDRRPPLDDRGDLFPRRERSPPSRGFPRDLSRDGRDPDRRDDRRFDRREDERRPEWIDRDRERDRDVDRSRRDLPATRVEGRPPAESVSGVNASYSATADPPINPARLAIIESSGVDAGARRPSTTPLPTAAPRRDQPPDTPAHLNGRADATAKRYGARASSPPSQAPPVPAFTFSVAPTVAGTQSQHTSKAALGSSTSQPSDQATAFQESSSEDKNVPPGHAPIAPKGAPLPPKAPRALEREAYMPPTVFGPPRTQDMAAPPKMFGTSRPQEAHHASPPAMAPKAPRAAYEMDAFLTPDSKMYGAPRPKDTAVPTANRLHGVRSLETLNPGSQQPPEAHAGQSPSSMPPSPGATRHALPNLAAPISPNPPQAPRFDVSAPSGPKVARASLAHTQVSPRPSFTSPRSDAGTFQQAVAPGRGAPPPEAAPSGPRNRSFSVSPKVPSSTIPTAPKASRPSGVPRTGDRGALPPFRPPEGPAGMIKPPFAPSGPRNLQWNQWRRPVPHLYGDKPVPTIPAKRDLDGEEKERPPDDRSDHRSQEDSMKPDRLEAQDAAAPVPQNSLQAQRNDDRMDIDIEPVKRKTSTNQGQSATHASFFGGAIARPEDVILDSSSEEDELDDEEDATLLEAKHARNERELRAQLVDLSAREYRATSPLEAIARLARLTARDLERLNEQRRDEMDTDDNVGESNRTDAPVTSNSSASEDGPEITTPRAEQETKVAIRETDDGHGNVRRSLRKTIEVISLPFLPEDGEHMPFQKGEEYEETVQDLEEMEPALIVAMEEIAVQDQVAEAEMVDAFADAYAIWRESCEQLDRVKEEQEKLERQLSQEPGPDTEAPLPAMLAPINEGRRAYKNSSEYEIEQVLKQSEETARIEQEKLDREAKKVQADMEKEALLPDQDTEEDIARGVLINVNRLRDPEALTLAFSYEPPPDDFDEKEQEIFIAAFKETPKKWGEIASLLPGRSYKDCIHHYYANKWDGRFRDNRTKKFKGGRRGRGGKATRPSRGSALMADLNRGEDLAQVTDTATGRPKRAAAPTTFGEKEAEAKSSIAGPSPAKKLGPGSKQDGNGEEKPAKKQRRAGEGKPGRKGKAQLAALAAAPSISPNKQPTTKEELSRAAAALEDASLLASLQSAHHGMAHPAEHHIVFNQESGHSQTVIDEAELHKPVPPAAKQSASSYWSVPEQTDFSKYIAHFGTDFAAIATHMGTKTQTMIKNHYQRQVDGGRIELQEAATLANQRRERGEDIGPPPTPTPITKRKYDNPQSGTPRAIAPQNDAMDTDEPVLQARPTVPQHASPPQFQAQPRYTTSAQSTPIPAQRVVPSPLPVTATPAAPLPPAAPHNRSGLQHPLGSRLGFLSDSRAEHRSGMQQNSMFRVGQESTPLPPRSQPQAPPQLSRTLSSAPDPQFIHNLRQEQERALRMQAQNEHEARVEHLHSRPPGMIPHTQGSPANQPLAMSAPERKPPFDERERGPTPPRSSFLPQGISRPPLLNPNPSTGSIPTLGASPLAPLTHRSPYNPSPPKPDLSRPGSVSASHAQPSSHFSNAAPPKAPTPAPEPKKSNLMSILNNTEPEETKPAPKRDSLPSAGPTRVASPAQPFGSAATPQPMTGAPTPRRETFGQSTMQHSGYHRSSFGTPGPMPASLKQEPSAAGSSSMQQPPKDHWSRMMGHSGQPNVSGSAPLDRDRHPRQSYGYPSHRSSAFGQPKANPSPPPHVLGHSRTPSYSAQQAQIPPREQTRSILGNHPPSTQASLHSNPYARQEQPPLPFSQPPASTQSRSHHSHNNSLGGEGPPSLQHFRGAPMDREEAFRREDEMRMMQQQQQHSYRRAEEASRFEALQRERDRAEQQHEMERARHEHAYQRSHGLPPQSMPPSTFNSPFAQSRQPMGGFSTSEQAMREAGAAMHHEEQRMGEHDERRRAAEQPNFMRDREGTTQFGGRVDDRGFLYGRTTPQGYRNGPGSFAPPPPRGR